VGFFFTDSGTTLLLVPQIILNQLQDTFKKVYPHLPGISGSQTIFNGYCLLGDEIIKDYPDLQFDFPGKSSKIQRLTNINYKLI